MVRILLGILLALFYTNVVTARTTVSPVFVRTQDTLPQVFLKEVTIPGKDLRPRQYARYRRRMDRLEYNVRKVYPYARIAASRIQAIDKRIAAVKEKKERKKIIKAEYSQMMQTFKKPLMKLSITQGRILIRLIYRETDNSAFAHIQEYKGSVNAYFWQSLALLFGNNLKADYEPQGRDYDIETIVQTLEKGE